MANASEADGKYVEFFKAAQARIKARISRRRLYAGDVDLIRGAVAKKLAQAIDDGQFSFSVEFDSCAAPHKIACDIVIKELTSLGYQATVQTILVPNRCRTSLLVSFANGED